MSKRQVVLRLNQQQTELLENTVAKGEADSRAALIRKALRAYAERHDASSSKSGDAR